MASNSNMTPRQRFVLATLAADPEGKFAPVQVQKFFFLIDEHIAPPKGVKFDFQPYDYGPFDHQVYRILESLENLGFVSIENAQGGADRRYCLTNDGRIKGRKILNDDFDKGARTHIRDLSKWVRSLSFAELVGAIYKDYPEMRKNSIFQN